MYSNFNYSIQVLRAFAVLLVVLSHFFNDIFSFGFVGVDVFFVISGYLIAKQLNNIKYSFKDRLWFLIRRFSRILPPLAIIIIFSALLSLLLLAAGFQNNLYHQKFASLFFYSNLYFWKNVNYFSESAQSLHFLHTWSLSVEMQFYFLACLVPVISQHKNIFWSMCVCLLFFVSILLYVRYPVAHYYWMPTRLYEFCFGVLAFYLNNKRNIYFFLILSFLFLTIYFVWNSWEEMKIFIMQLASVVTTFFILWKGIDLYFNYRLYRKIMLLLGNSSYSIYLIHQPVFVWLSYIYVESHYSYLHLGVLLLFTMIAGIFFHKTIEMKIVKLPFKAVLSCLVISTVFVAGSAYLQQAKAVDGSFDFSSLNKPALGSICPEGIARGCSELSSKPGAGIVILGDSHSISMFRQTVKIQNLTNERVAVSSKAGCPPLLEISLTKKFRYGDDCNVYNLDNYRLLLAMKEAKMVILIGRWSYYSDFASGERRYLYDLDSGNLITNVPDRVFSTVKYLKTLVPEVLVIEEVPRLAVNPKRMYNKVLASNNSSTKPEIHIGLSRHQAMLNEQIAVAVHAAGGRMVPTREIFCEAKLCKIGTREYSFYFDDDHVGIKGAELIIDQIFSKTE